MSGENFTLAEEKLIPRGCNFIDYEHKQLLLYYYGRWRGTPPMARES